MEQAPRTVDEALVRLAERAQRPRARWPGVLAGALVLAVWRVASVRAFVEERDAALWLEVALGALGDLGWVAAIYAALDRGAPAGDEPRARVARAFAWCLVAGCLVLRAADFVHAWLTLAWFDAATWALASDGAGRVVFESGGPWVIAAALASGHALWLGWGGRRARAGAPSGRRPRRRLPGALGVASAATALSIGALALGDPQHGARHPELGIAASVIDAVFLQAHAPAALPAVDDAAWSRWQARGWVAADARPDTGYPLRRAPEPPVAGGFGRVAGQPGRVAGRPDVIVIYVESLNAGWLPAWRAPDDPPPWPLPALSALGDGAAAPGGAGWTVVRGYHGAARPTLEGITASLCGVLPGPVALDVASPGALPPRDCLPALLRERGWLTSYLQGSPLGFTGLDAQLPAVGFSEVRGARALREGGASAGLGPWGARDAETFAAAAATVDRLRAGRAPYMLVIAGVDSHWPGDAAAPCAASSGCAGDAICAGLWCADRAVGAFLAHLDAVGALDDSLVVVTADHTMPDAPDVRARLGARWRGRFGELALHVRVPWGGLPPILDVPSTNLDLAPTLARWLGLRPPRVAWLGAALDGDRRRRGGAVGRKGQRALAWLSTRGQPQVASPAAWARRCRRGGSDTSPATGPSQGSAPVNGTLACDLVDWLAWYDALWTARRVAPPPLDGAPPARGAED